MLGITEKFINHSANAIARSAKRTVEGGKTSYLEDYKYTECVVGKSPSSSRIYIGYEGTGMMDLKDLAKHAFNEGKELKGNGIRTYSTAKGWFLSLFGYSMKVDFGDKRCVYLNKRSLGKLALRALDALATQNAQGLETPEVTMDNLYASQVVKNKKVDEVSAIFQQGLKHEEFNDMNPSLRFKSAFALTLSVLRKEQGLKNDIP